MFAFFFGYCWVVSWVGGIRGGNVSQPLLWVGVGGKGGGMGWGKGEKKFQMLTMQV